MRLWDVRLSNICVSAAKQHFYSSAKFVEGEKNQNYQTKRKNGKGTSFEFGIFLNQKWLLLGNFLSLPKMDDPIFGWQKMNWQQF